MIRAEQDCCAAGIRTVVGDINDNFFTQAQLLSMALSAEVHLDNDPSMGVRELTTQLAEGQHLVEGMGSTPEEPTFIWGPVGRTTPEEHRKRPIYPDSEVTTERLALAIATCATRDCTKFERCRELARKRGWTHAEPRVELIRTEKK